LKDLLDKLQDRVVAKGEGWQRTRDSFSRLLGQVGFAANLASKQIAGEYTSRAHRDDPKAKLPFESIPLEKQRRAIKLLKEEILSDRAFKFSPELLKRLAPEHFRDDDFFFFSNYEFNVNDRVLAIQRMVMSRFLDSSVLRAIQNSELHAAKDQPVLQLPEVFDALTDAIWTELPTAGHPADKKSKLEISTIRRNLQREHVKRLSNLVLGPNNDFSDFIFLLFDDFGQPAPADARALARHHLKTINGRIELALDKSDPDAYSRAHLEQLHAQIEKVFASSLRMNEP
jgi:hypothetical protein